MRFVATDFYRTMEFMNHFSSEDYFTELEYSTQTQPKTAAYAAVAPRSSCGVKLEGLPKSKGMRIQQKAVAPQVFYIYFG